MKDPRRSPEMRAKRIAFAKREHAIKPIEDYRSKCGEGRLLAKRAKAEGLYSPTTYDGDIVTALYSFARLP